MLLMKMERMVRNRFLKRGKFRNLNRKADNLATGT